MTDPRIIRSSYIPRPPVGFMGDPQILIRRLGGLKRWPVLCAMALLGAVAYLLCLIRKDDLSTEPVREATRLLTYDPKIKPGIIA